MVVFDIDRGHKFVKRIPMAGLGTDGNPLNVKGVCASLATGSSLTARLLRAAGKLGVEQRGIERVPEDERTETGFMAMLNISTMWFSANMVVAAFALGLLAQSVFNLGVADAMLVILFFNLIGITPVCFFSTFGPRFGLWVSSFSFVDFPLSCRGNW